MAEVSILIKLKDMFSTVFQTIADKMKSVGEKSEELQGQMDAVASAVSARVTAIEEAYQREIGTIKDVGKAYDILTGQIAGSVSMVKALRTEIAALKSKTITITVRKVTIIVTKKEGGSSKGSNPFSETGAGMPMTITKDITEKEILPALKTLEREGKIAPGTVLQ